MWWFEWYWKSHWKFVSNCKNIIKGNGIDNHTEILSFVVEGYCNHTEKFQNTLKHFQRYSFVLFSEFSALLKIFSVIFSVIVS